MVFFLGYFPMTAVQGLCLVIVVLERCLTALRPPSAHGYLNAVFKTLQYIDSKLLFSIHTSFPKFMIP